jgi:hypothetical protein
MPSDGSIPEIPQSPNSNEGNRIVTNPVSIGAARSAERSGESDVPPTHNTDGEDIEGVREALAAQGRGKTKDNYEGDSDFFARGKIEEPNSPDPLGEPQPPKSEDHYRAKDQLSGFKNQMRIGRQGAKQAVNSLKRNPRR